MLSLWLQYQGVGYSRSGIVAMMCLLVWCMLLMLGLVWGVHYSLIKISLDLGLSYLLILCCIVWGSAAVLLSWGWLRGYHLLFSWRYLGYYSLCGVLGFAVPMLLELSVATHLDAGCMVMVAATIPLFTLVIGWLIRPQTFQRRVWLGVGVGAVACLLLLPAMGAKLALSLTWLGLMALVPVCCALYNNVVYHLWPAELTTWQVATGEALAMSLLLLPWVCVYLPEFQLISIPYTGALALGVMVLLSVLEIWLYFEVVRRAGAVFVAQGEYVGLISGMCFAVWLLAEQPSVWLWLGVGLLLFALYLAAPAPESEPLDSSA